jgi:ABC-type dipeptide/oligopeptide/nickel transport system ATPase component
VIVYEIDSLLITTAIPWFDAIGESGTGKSLTAKQMRSISRRREKGNHNHKIGTIL